MNQTNKNATSIIYLLLYFCSEDKIIMNIFLIALFCIVANFPFGKLRVKQKKFSLLWLVYIHAPVPLIILFRMFFNVSSAWAPVFIVASLLGQYLGAKAGNNEGSGFKK